MQPIDGALVRATFVNVSKKERANIPMPDLDLDWSHLEYLGWRDPKRPRVGFVVAEVDGEPVGVALQRTEASSRTRPQCSWCEDVTLPNDVVSFNARRAGDAGRKGDSVSTLVCAAFECPVNVRTQPTARYVGFDVEAAMQRRIAALGEHVEAFVRAVRDGR
ncbi:FBP domain-containing protein [Agrococcus jejuensis]|uniref:FBP C-terminal treble-clef zinc-finger n=1 Tax=Agrococcus jejuensis TaxID=399736 RepID=A0A1G8E090_9MICO|nr:FBP domain-containing protein [Agrococcus jejuensis]SDH63251.1 FBP C-terminal treble-clef zinc-finger [Agrococcus jejuensis]